MSDYIEAEKVIYIPLKPVIVKFHEKEEVELNAFQNFILEAVEDGAVVEQMADATLLTKNVIESEILQMERQRLLIREGDALALSELSRDILMVARSVKMLNEERKVLCVNLVTGGIEGYEEGVCRYAGKDVLILGEKIKPRDVDGINMEENIAFFADYMASFRNLPEEQIDKVISSIYAEFHESDEAMVYKRQEIRKLPCLTGNGRLKLEGDLQAEGKSLVIMVKVSTDSVERYESQIRNAAELYSRAPELLSDSGRDLIAEYETCENCNKENLKFVFDCVSGKIRELDYGTTDESNKRSQLMLGAEKEMDEEAERQIFAIAKAKWNLDERYHIKMADIGEQIYRIGFCLDELRGATDVEE